MQTPVCLYDQNEAAATDRKLNKAKTSNYTNQYLDENESTAEDLCSMDRNITETPDGACFGNVLKDVKNTAAGGEDGSKKVMIVATNNQETCYPLSSFQAPHEPWYEEPMFNPVQLSNGGYVHYVLLMI